MQGDESGASELVDETLIIALGIVLAVVTVMLVTGVIPLTPKSAYLAPQFKMVEVSGKPVIAIFHRAGDTVFFNAAPSGEYTAELHIDTESGSFRAAPDPALTRFSPGTWIVVYYTGSGFIAAPNLSGASFASLPSGKITVRFIDTKSGVLIAKEDLVPGTGTVTITATTTMTTSATTTTTTSPAVTPSTTTTSATSTTATATSTPVPTPTCCPHGWYVNGKCTCDTSAKARGCC